MAFCQISITGVFDFHNRNIAICIFNISEFLTLVYLGFFLMELLKYVKTPKTPKTLKPLTSGILIWSGVWKLNFSWVQMVLKVAKIETHFPKPLLESSVD